MTNPRGTFHNAITGETITRELTDEEVAELAELAEIETDETPFPS